METKTIKGIVQAINQEFKSVKLDEVNYSGKYSYKGLLPSVGDEVEMQVVSAVSKKDGKTYWNIQDLKVLNSSPSPLIMARESKSIDMMLSYAKDLVVAGKAETLDKACDALIVARTLLMTKL
jgi:hypothetical protein